MTDASDAAPAGGEARRPAGRGGYMASTVKHGLVYFLGNVLSRLAGFIKLPVYTRLLTTRDYGILEILSLSADILGMLAGLGIRQAVLRLYYQYDDEAERGAVMSTATFLVLGIFGAITVTGTVLAPWISTLLLGPNEPTIFVRLAVLSFVIGALGDIPGVYLQAQQRSATLVSANTVRLLLGLGLNILFVVGLRLGVAGIFYSAILSAAIVGSVLAWGMFRATGLRFVGRHARDLLAFGAPLVASNLGSFVLHFSDRYFLRAYHSLAVVGVYALSYKFALLIAMFVDGPFNSIWSAKALEIHQREGAGAPPILRAILQQYVLVVITAALGAALFATDAIHLLLGPAFRDADRPIPVLAVAMVFFCFRHVSQTGAMIAKRPGDIALVTSSAAVLAVLLNVLLIPRWAAMGAAVATAAAFAMEFMVMRRRSERAYPLGLGVGIVLKPLGLATLAWIAPAVAVPASAPWAVALAARVVAFGLYVAALAATGLLDAPARRMLAGSVRDPRAIIRALRNA